MQAVNQNSPNFGSFKLVKKLPSKKLNFDTQELKVAADQKFLDDFGVNLGTIMGGQKTLKIDTLEIFYSPKESKAMFKVGCDDKMNAPIKKIIKQVFKGVENFKKN